MSNAMFRGRRLAGLLNDLIDSLTSDDVSRADVISSMASAAGITEGTVNEILNAEINCPPRHRLAGFSRVLPASLSTMIAAAERDGCDYGNSKTRARVERRFLSHRAADVRLDQRDGAPGPKISGMAAVYYDGTSDTEFELWPGAIERIMPGAFDRALSEKDDARALFNHNPDHLLGRVSAGTLTLSSVGPKRADGDRPGLKYVIDPGDTSIARDVIAHIGRGDLQGSSFAFQVTDEEWLDKDEAEIREIRGVRLFDVGPVTYPAYESTTTGIKSADGNEARESWERWKRSQAVLEADMAERKARRLHVEGKIRT